MLLQVPVVIDTGSDTTKVGFAGELNPRTIFPTVLKRSGDVGLSLGSSSTCLVGEEAEVMSKKGNLVPRHPVEHGVINNWDDCEQLWQYALFNKLKIKPEDHPFLLAEKVLNPKACRAKMLQIFFETMKAPALCVANTAELAMLACGKKHGVVLDGGKQLTHIVPVYERKIIPRAIIKIATAGDDVTDLMYKLLMDKGIEVSIKDANIAKIEKCSVAADSEQEFSGFSSDKRFFRTSTGDTVTLGKEITLCPEVLFNPTLRGSECPGIHKTLYNSVMKCDEDRREKMFSNIVLSGGSTMFPGLPERLTMEMMELVPSKYIACVNVHAAWDRHLMAWQGGSTMASEGQFFDKCFTSYMYDEYGPYGIHTIC